LCCCAGAASVGVVVVLVVAAVCFRLGVALWGAFLLLCCRCVLIFDVLLLLLLSLQSSRELFGRTAVRQRIVVEVKAHQLGQQPNRSPSGWHL
jgi:hypothetical protein